MSDGKGGRGGEQLDKSKGRGTSAKDSLTGLSTASSKTPRTPEAQAAPKVSNARSQPISSTVVHQGSLGMLIERLCAHSLPLNHPEMIAFFEDQLKICDAMARTCLEREDCQAALSILNDKEARQHVFEIIRDIMEEIGLDTNNAPSNGRWATTYLILLLFVITQLQRVYLNRWDPSMLPGNDIVALVGNIRNLWMMWASREVTLKPSVANLYLAFCLLRIDCNNCGSRVGTVSTCLKCQSTSTSYKTAKASHDKAKGEYGPSVASKTLAPSKQEMAKLRKQWDIDHPAPSEVSAAPLDSLLENQQTAPYRRLLKIRYMS